MSRAIVPKMQRPLEDLHDSLCIYCDNNIVWYFQPSQRLWVGDCECKEYVWEAKPIRVTIDRVEID